MPQRHEIGKELRSPPKHYDVAKEGWVVSEDLPFITQPDKYSTTEPQSHRVHRDEIGGGVREPRLFYSKHFQRKAAESQRLRKDRKSLPPLWGRIKVGGICLVGQEL